MDGIQKKAHPFARTLGPGPYRWVGTFDLGRVIGALNAGNVNGYNAGLESMPKMESGQGSCSHCGHGILLIQIIETAEGKRYGVGSDCVMKIYADGGELQNLTAMEKEIKQRKRIQGQESRERRRIKLRDECFAMMDEHKNTFMNLVHPSDYHAAKGLTFWDYCEWWRIRTNASLGAFKELKFKIELYLKEKEKRAI